MHVTLEKFGYPGTLIRQYDHWAVLARPAQVTCGSLVLAALSEATAFGDLPAGAHAELAQVAHHIEAALRSAVAYDKLNYLMLMMVDPQVHFHVLPRYNGSRSFAGYTRADLSWPKPPNLADADVLTPDALASVVSGFKVLWPKA